MKLSPLNLNILLHLYAIAEPMHHPDLIVYTEAKEELIFHGLIRYDHESPNSYSMTKKGIAFVHLILSTPLPQKLDAWIDPRTKEIIE